MTLRTRLFWTSAVIAVPLVIALILLEERARLSAMERELRRAVDIDLAVGLRARCETGIRPIPPPRPQSGGPPPPPPDRSRPPGGPIYQLSTYSADGTAASPAGAPALPAAEVSTFWAGVQRGIQLRFEIGGAADCAIGLARLPPRPGQLRDQAMAILAATLAMLAGVWLAVGPVIARMRRLGGDVRQSAASMYQTPVRVEADDELGELARAFNDAGATVRSHLQEVQAREQTLRQFVADTTHDVAIPLTVVQGHLWNLDAALSQETAPAPARAEAQAAIRELHYMASLLRNLGVATKLGEASAPLVLAPVDLNALVERVVARHMPLARASDVSLDYAVPETPLTTPLDATLVEQAAGNLVDNAVRYNRPGGHVAVVLDRVGPDGFTLTVTDDGPGVPAEDLAVLTERWFRGSDARTRRPDGKGLGLAIASEACVRLGLTLAFSRPAEGGLTATIAR